MICQCRLIPAPKYSDTNPLSGWHRSGGKTIPVSCYALLPVLASATLTPDMRLFVVVVAGNLHCMEDKCTDHWETAMSTETIAVAPYCC